MQKLQQDKKEYEESDKALAAGISNLEYEYEKCKMEIKV